MAFNLILIILIQSNVEGLSLSQEHYKITQVYIT